ncbi:class I SAM-dependent methyltransferase [bacterium]|nr:class I SAM-dependent methyltransferase [bacterium]
MDGKLYKNPTYYDMAFCSFRDVKSEVNLVEDCIERFSKIPVKKVLELACGPSPNVHEIVSRGYQYYGLDLCQSMIDYCKNKYASIKDKANFIKGNMLDFKVDSLIGEVDLAVIMYGSFFPKNSDDIYSNLNSVAAHLKVGGLYLLDTCVVSNHGKHEPIEYTHKINKTELKVKMIPNVIDQEKHILEYTLIVDVHENDRRFQLKSSDIFMEITRQEFELIVEGNPFFELCGFYNEWDLEKPLGKNGDWNRPITIFRRI